MIRASYKYFVMRQIQRCVMVSVTVSSCLSLVQAEDPLDFNREVRPILADRCYACHGPDEHSREADLRLDRQYSVLGTNEQGAAIVPGKPDLSELVRRINSDDEGEIMPPPELNKPLTALLKDLKQRDLLKDTLVIWGGEFGRTPVAQVSGKTYGRDHHPHAFTMWLAGGGTRSGLTFGTTDEFGYHVAEDPVHVRDLHATILHLLGIDHHRFKYKFKGLDLGLTGVDPAHVVKEILA